MTKYFSWGLENTEGNKGTTLHTSNLTPIYKYWHGIYFLHSRMTLLTPVHLVCHYNPYLYKILYWTYITSFLYLCNWVLVFKSSTFLLFLLTFFSSEAIQQPTKITAFSSSSPVNWKFLSFHCCLANILGITLSVSLMKYWLVAKKLSWADGFHLAFCSDSDPPRRIFKWFSKDLCIQTSSFL